MQLFEKTLGDFLEYWAEKTPDKEFIVYSDRDLRFTYSEFNKRVNNLAKGMMAIGVEKTPKSVFGQRTYPIGSHFCLHLPKSEQFWLL